MMVELFVFVEDGNCLFVDGNLEKWMCCFCSEFGYDEIHDSKMNGLGKNDMNIDTTLGCPKK